MIDGVGNISSALVVGAANPLCLAVVDRLVGPRLANAFVLDSDPNALARGAQRIRGYGIPNVIEQPYSEGSRADQQSAIENAFSIGDIDVVIIGPTPNPPDAESASDFDTRHFLESKLVDMVALAELSANAVAAQGHGVITLLTHTPKRANKSLDPRYCAAMAAFNLLALPISETAGKGGGRVVCAELDPNRDPNAPVGRELRSSTMSPLEVASQLAPAITTRKRTRSLVTVRLPKSFRKSVSRLRAS